MLTWPRGMPFEEWTNVLTSAIRTLAQPAYEASRRYADLLREHDPERYIREYEPDRYSAPANGSCPAPEGVGDLAPEQRDRPDA